LEILNAPVVFRAVRALSRCGGGDFAIVGCDRPARTHFKETQAMITRKKACAAIGCGLEMLEGRRLLSGNTHHDDFVTQTNLVSDGATPAALVDPNLVNPWGISNLPGGPFWVSDNEKGLATLYDGAGAKAALEVSIPGAGGGDAAPTGQVSNTGTGFVVTDGTKSGPAKFIFAGEDGGITGWSPAVNPNEAFIAVDHSTDGAIFKGLAKGDAHGQTYLYATDFHNGRVDVFDSSFTEQHWSGAFVDRHIPQGFAPFGIQNLNGKIYVTYAKQDADAEDDVAGSGNGFVDVFNTSGHLLRRFEHKDALNSPWGLTVAPDDWGQFGGDILVGQFGSGQIAAYNSHGKFEGLLRSKDGSPVTIDGLWGLTFGGDAKNADPETLYFTAGTNHEADGLFGTLSLTQRDHHDHGDGNGHGQGKHHDDDDDGHRSDDDKVWH
jgi:uncharacterized protein (TIGR03118 family)